MVRYRCTGCRRGLSRQERVRLDDPQAPLGPEWLCPHCDSRVTMYTSRWIAVLAGVVAGVLGLTVGHLVSRW